MRKITMLNWMSVDGYYADSNGGIDWMQEDIDVDKYLHGTPNQDEKPGTVIFGRVTYQLFESVWPKMAADPKAPKAMRDTGEQLDQMYKIVFSKTLEQVTWKNTWLIKGDPAEETKKIKNSEGTDIMIFGSGTIVQQLSNAGLIDDYLIVMTPVVLGNGKKLFENVNKINLKLKEAKDFKSGNVILHYVL